MASWRNLIKNQPETLFKRHEKSDIQDNYPTYRIFTVEKIFSEAVTKLDTRRIMVRKKNRAERDKLK